jgi:undecaprenyl diphosphate synthase
MDGDPLRKGEREGSILQPSDQIQWPMAIPQHVAIIADGTRRWGERNAGDVRAGIKPAINNVVPLVLTAARVGVEAITFFAFSTENGKRPEDQVDTLWATFSDAWEPNSEQLHRENVRIRFIGRTLELPDHIQLAMSQSERLTASNDRMTAYVALNYGGQTEILDAAKKVVESGISALDLDKETFSHHLYAPEMPEVDLLIRPGGELRVSNFLLWHLSYAEFYFTDTLWPDFSPTELLEALEVFSRRSRRFGL